MPVPRRRASSWRPWLVAVATLASSTIAAKQADVAVLHPDIDAVIRNAYVSPRTETRYLDGSIDLNGDGESEILVYVLGRTACDGAGCTTLVFSPTETGYQLVSTITRSNLPVRASTTAVDGWRDLIVTVSGGGDEPRDVVLSFDGMSYPSDPTVWSAQVKLATGEVAETVIEQVASIDESKPFPSTPTPRNRR